MKTTLETTPLLFSLDEAAALLKISSRTLCKIIMDGKVPCVRLGARRLIANSWLADQGVDLPPVNDSGLVDAKGTSRLLGVSPRHLWRFTQSGEIPSRRFGDRGVRYSIAELKQFIDGRNQFVECDEANHDA